MFRTFGSSALPVAELLFACALPACTPLAAAEFPPPEQLIQKAVEARKAQTALGLKFTWREEVENRDEKDRPLKPFQRTYEVIMLEGENYRKLVLIDGKPPDDAMLQKIQADMEKERELRRKHAFLNKAVPFGGGPGQLLLLFDNKVVGEETVGGRKAWRIESDPKPGVKGANQAEEEVLATHGTTWFDEEEGVEVRRKVVYTRSIHNIKPDSTTDTEWGKVGDAGNVWLPSSAYQRTHVSPGPGFNSYGNVRVRYFDYKRFSVESSIAPN